MAASGTIYTDWINDDSSGSTVRLEVSYSESNIDITSNTSKISWTAYVGIQQGGGYYRTLKSAYVTVDNSSSGNIISDTDKRYYDGDEITSGSKTINHEDDGSKTIIIKIEFTTNYNTSRSKSQNVTLEVIDREAKLTPNKPEVSPNDTTVRVTLSPFVKDFKYVIRRKVGDKAWEENWKTLGNGSTTSYFDDTYNNIKTRAGTDGSYKVTYECTTYNGTTVVGTAQNCFIYTFYPGDPKPMELYQGNNLVGISFLNKTSQPGFWVGGKGPISVSTTTFTLDDGNEYNLLGIWD